MRFRLRTLMIVLALAVLAVFLWNPLYVLTYIGELFVPVVHWLRYG